MPRIGARAFGLMVVLLLHGTLLWLLGQGALRRWGEPARNPQLNPPLLLRWIVREAAAPEPAAKRVEDATAKPPRPKPSAAAAALTRAANPGVRPNIDDEAPTPAATTPQAITLMPADASSAPLKLALPAAAAASAPSMRSQALNDPRANSARKTIETRAAQAMGGDQQIIEEPMGDGRMRLRRGSKCAEVHLARSGQLEPFDESVRPTPRLVKPCD